MPLIPFDLMPGSWGLKGKTREIAKAEYELKGFDLEVRLLEINKEEMENIDFLRKRLEITKKWDKIDESAYHRALADLIEDKEQQELAIAEIDFREGLITDTAYAKKMATIKKEPWVNVVNMDFTKKSSLEGSFELDWNEAFVEKLTAEGYTGPTPDNIVNQWFMELCRNIAMEEFDGTGDFAADSEANIEAVKRWSSDSVPLGKGRTGYK